MDYSNFIKPLNELVLSTRPYFVNKIYLKPAELVVLSFGVILFTYIFSRGAFKTNDNMNDIKKNLDKTKDSIKEISNSLNKIVDSITELKETINKNNDFGGAITGVLEIFLEKHLEILSAVEKVL